MKEFLDWLIYWVTFKPEPIMPEPTTLEYRNAQWRGEFYAKFYANMQYKE